MSSEEYLRGILEQQELTENQIQNLENQRDVILIEILEEIGGNPKIYNGGSYAKGTMIQAGYDLDIVLYWHYNFQLSPRNLYNEVGIVLQRNGRSPRSKKVGWEIPFPGYFHIDVIPGKKIFNQRNFAYLYNNDVGGRFKSSVKKQVLYVKKSRRQDVIRLMKLWKIRKDVPIKTFLLENFVITACKGLKRSELENQLIHIFEYISNNILTIKIIDPANPNNIVSNDLNENDKNQIKNLADEALDASSWRSVIY